MSKMSSYSLSFVFNGEQDGQQYEEEVLSFDVFASDYEHASVLADSLSKIMTSSNSGGVYSGSANAKE